MSAPDLSRDLGQAILDRLEEKQREISRLQTELEAAVVERRRAEEAYSNLAALLGDQLRVEEHYEILRCQRRVRVELFVDDTFAAKDPIARAGVVHEIARTLYEGLLLKLAAADASDWKRAACAREVLRHLRVPEPGR